jgi:predicted NAD-dependent protein-ADP-ribosyltransferase YbiA (DUF1768 family)
VLLLKFKQHEDLRKVLLDTYPADLVYTVTDDSYWGQDPGGHGANEFGKALARVRLQLRAEGYHTDT